MSTNALLLAAFFSPALALAQQTTDNSALLERLDRLEQQNRAMADEIHALRVELTKRTPQPQVQPAVEADIGEQVAVNQQRISDLSEVKVEAGQKFPVRLTGMALFNAFTNSAPTGGTENPVVVPPLGGGVTDGATMRQSIVGLEFSGPRTIAGGKLSGSLYMDFFGGSTGTLNHLVRLRTGSIQMDWRNTTVMFGQQKPIFSPRDPTSLAQVGVSPLTASGNPWLWLPQVRVEQRFSFGEQAGLRAQIGVIQTNEQSASLDPEYAPTLSSARPGLEGRFEFRLHRGIEIAPGFHVSTSHVLGMSVPSNVVSVDWLIVPWSKLQLTGLLYSGENTANLGTLRQGFKILYPSGTVEPVHSTGGWAQLAFLATNRLSFHLMCGQHDDRNSDLTTGGISKNLAFAANVMYRISPNVVIAFESEQLNTTYVGAGTRKNLHNDLAIAYQF
jgi:hypothetical protein